MIPPLSTVSVATPGVCVACRHFRNDPAQIERLCPGLTAMGSGYASTRAQDGICLRHDFYVLASDRCGDFASVVSP
jgi:hypothetical protein